MSIFGGSGDGGGPLGGLGMDLGLYKMPIVGGFFQDPNEAHKQKQFHQAAQAYSAYRPELAQAHMNALGQRLTAMQGAGDVLGAMSGRPGQNLGAGLTQNPMGPSMMQQGNPGATGGGGGLLGDSGIAGLIKSPLGQLAIGGVGPLGPLAAGQAFGDIF